MKKSLISIFLFLICHLGYGQFPIQQNIGAATTLVKNPNYGGFQGGLIPYSFLDTSAANTALTYLKTYNGALVYTTSDSSLWFRCCGANKWSPLLQSGGTSGIQAWLINGNTAFSSSIPPTIGTIGLSSIGTKTNNTLRYTVPAAGIVNNNGAGVKILGIDTSDATLPLVYTEGSAAGWELTGNAGTVAGTNFIGTTDAQDFMFKRNSEKSGYIGTIETSLGYRSLLLNVGEDNVAVGHYTMGANTLGNANTVVGAVAFGGNTTGSNNTGVGYSTLADNNGSANTAVGIIALNANSSGNSNTALGDGALLSNTTGSNNLGLGAAAGAFFTTESNRIFLNTINRVNKLGDSTESSIYIAQDSTAASQRAYINARTFLPYIPSGVGTKAVRINPGTGELTYADTTTSSGGTVTGSGTTNYLPKWSSSTALGNSSIYDDGTNVGINKTSSFAAKFDVLGSSTSGVATAARFVSGTGTSAGGIRIGNVDATYGAIFSNNVTPSATNYFAASNGTELYLNAGSTGKVNIQNNGAGVVFAVSGTATTTTIPFSVTASGAASTPAITATGTWFTGGTATTTKPQLLIEPTGTTSTAWSTAGTGLGVNSATGFTGNLFDMQLNGTTKIYGRYDGYLRAVGGIESSTFMQVGGTSFIQFQARTYIQSNADGNLSLLANAGGFGLLQFGGTTTSFPAIARNGTGIDIKLADNSAYAGLGAAAITQTISSNYAITATRAGTSGVANQLLNSSGVLYGGVDNSAGGFLFTGGLPYAGFIGTGAAYPMQFGTNSTVKMTIESGGNVGIGTTAPATRLQLEGTGATNNLFFNTTDFTSTASGIQFQISGTKRGEFTMNATSGEIKIGGTGGGGYFPTFYANGTEAMRMISGGNVLIGTTTDNSKLTVNGSFATAYRAITALRTLDATDHTINCTANTFTVTLPTAASIAGRQYTIVNSGAGVITIGTTSSQTFTNINGTPTTLTLDAVAAAAVTSYTVVSNGANWIVVSKVINP